MQTTKKQYLVFISHNHGEHTNTIVDSASEAWWSIQGILEEDEFKSICSELEASIDVLKDGENMWREFADGTWATITRRDIKKASATNNEIVAIINALRVYQGEEDRADIIDELGLDQDNMSDDEIETLIQHISLGEMAVEYAKPIVINKSLAERLREMAEGMAVGNYTSQDNTVSYKRFMASKNVHKITSIWEPFERDDTENIQKNVGNDARNLVGFAETAINTMTVGDMMEVISQRAVEAGAVDSKSQLSLLALKSIGGGARDSFGHNLEDADECFGNINDFDDDSYGGADPEVLKYLKKASAFGISYVNAY